MGLFNVKVKLASLAAPGRTEEVSLLVDAGATLSWIPREILQKLGVTAFSRLPFLLADGRRLERDVTAALLTFDGRKASVPVVFGEPGEEAVLGATALEVLGFVVDPIAKELVARDLLALWSVRRDRNDSVLPGMNPSTREQSWESPRILEQGATGVLVQVELMRKGVKT